MNSEERLKSHASLLALIERRRRDAGDANVASAIERSIIDRHLKELEADILEDPGALEGFLVRIKPPRR